MKAQTLLLRIAGFISLLFVVFHLLFHLMFNWGNTLSVLSSINRAIFLTYHAICILMLLLMGIVPIFKTKALLSSSIKYSILSFFSVFYLIRIVAEFTLFGISCSSPAILIMCLVPMIFYAAFVFKTYNRMNKLKNSSQLFIMRGTALVCFIPLFHKGVDLLSVEVYNDGQ